MHLAPQGLPQLPHKNPLLRVESAEGSRPVGTKIAVPAGPMLEMAVLPSLAQVEHATEGQTAIVVKQRAAERCLHAICQGTEQYGHPLCDAAERGVAKSQLSLQLATRQEYQTSPKAA